jgi:hypothetical protein
MDFRAKLLCLIPVLLTSAMAVQTLSVDMDTAAGIQATATSGDTGQLLTVQVRLSGAESMFSYQYKLAFDTARLVFVNAELDFGFSGERNILCRNGGMTLPVCQLQQNPPAADTIEISGTIIGSDAAKCVSGDGLAGVIRFRSKTQYNDSCRITVCRGYTANFSGDLMSIDNYAAGVYRVFPVTRVTRRGNGVVDRQDISSATTVIVQIGTAQAAYDLPACAGRFPVFRLLTPGGQLVATQVLRADGKQRNHIIPLHTTTQLPAGIYIGSIDINGLIVSKTIRYE